MEICNNLDLQYSSGYERNESCCISKTNIWPVVGTRGKKRKSPHKYVCSKSVDHQVRSIHRLLTNLVCTKFHGKPSCRCWDISVVVMVDLWDMLFFSKCITPSFLSFLRSVGAIKAPLKKEPNWRKLKMLALWCRNRSLTFLHRSRTTTRTNLLAHRSGTLPSRCSKSRFSCSYQIFTQQPFHPYLIYLPQFIQLSWSCITVIECNWIHGSQIVKICNIQYEARCFKRSWHSDFFSLRRRLSTTTLEMLLSKRFCGRCVTRK